MNENVLWLRCVTDLDPVEGTVGLRRPRSTLASGLLGNSNISPGSCDRPIQGWDPTDMHFFVGNTSRLGILSTRLQTLRPHSPACGTVHSENRFVNFDRRVKLSLRKYLTSPRCLRVTTSCLIRQYLPYGPTTSKRGACWFFSCLHIIANTAHN